MKIRTLASAGFVSMALTFIGNQAFAASPTFNCNKATKPSEHTICANPSLARLENEFVDRYYEYIALLKKVKRKDLRRNFRRQHRSNIYSIESCGSDSGCIRHRYEEAIADYNTALTAHH